MVGTWRCITNGTSTIRSMIRFEIRFWRMLWTIPAISSTTRGTGTWTILLHSALLNALLWDQSHNFYDLVHDLRNVLNNLRLAISTQPPKITVLAYMSQFLSRRVDIECASSLTCPNIPDHQRPRQALIADVDTTCNFRTLLVDADGA